MNIKVKKYVEAWIEYQRASKALDALKPEVLDLIPEVGIEVDGYRVTVSERPIFSGVTLDTAREFGAVKKVVNTSVLSGVLKEGQIVDGTVFSKYINVRHTI